MTSTAGSRAARPIMADVARLAGVSHQTVSRVLNNHPNVRSRTRDNVLAAVSELGYRPNAAARSLVTRRTHTLGVITFDNTLYGPASMLHGIEQAARPAYSVTIVSLPAFDRASVRAATDHLLRLAVEGIIIIAPQSAAVAGLSGMTADVPLLALGCGILPTLLSVAIDNAGGAHIATSYLLSLGHRTVHHLAGPAFSQDAQERVDGWREALRTHGSPVSEPRRGDWSARSGYQLGLQLALRPEVTPEVTAVLCGNDQMALGLLRALSERGIRVPADISVVGFDDIPEAEFFLPPLSTMQQDFAELGRRALRLLVEQINGDPASPVIPVAAQLVIRASTAGPGRRARLAGERRKAAGVKPERINGEPRPCPLTVTTSRPA